jgi:hypothetical protein
MKFEKYEKYLLILLILSAFLTTLSPIWDPDCFWHLAFGKYIFENKTLVKTEPFSFVREGEETTDLSWLPHTLFYRIYKNFGYLGCEIFVSFLAVLTIIVLILLSKNLNKTMLPLVFYFSIFFTAFGGRFKLRPEGVTLVLFAFLIYLLTLYRENKLKYSISFFFLFLLWTQIHPSWIYGLILIPLYLFEKHLFSFGKLFFKDLFLIFILPIFSLFLNPYGYKPILFPFASFLTMKSDSSFSIAEWQKSPFTLSTAPFIIFSFACVVFALYNFLKKKETFLPFIVSLVQLLFLLLWVRYSSFAFIGLTFVATKMIESIIEKVSKLKKILIYLSFVLVVSPMFTIFRYQPTKEILYINYPEAETNFLISEKIYGNIEHTFVAGGFVEFKTYPYSKSFIDGRYFDFEKEIKEFSKAKENLEIFQKFLEKYPFEIAIMPYTKAKINIKNNEAPRNAQAILLPKENWAPIFYGPYGTIFLKRLPKYSKFIEKYEYKILFPYDKEFIFNLVKKGEAKEEDLKKEVEKAFKTEAKFLREKDD